jgi:hypothetical protein
VARNKQNRRWEKARAPLGLAFVVACLAGAGTWATTGCSGWDPTSPFERNSPQVNEAIEAYDSGKLETAEQILEAYLGTGPCGDAGIGLPDSVRQKPNGSFDLGLTLFHLAERYGRRFGEEEQASDSPDDPAQVEMRNIEIECALVIVKAIAADPSVPPELRARARYLAGNLEFLRKKYEQAVAEYDQALQIVPGLDEETGGDGIGRDAAWNRAIALRRIQDKKDASQDSPDDADGSDGDDGSDGSDGADAPEDAPDSGPDAPDGGEDGGDGGEDGGPPDAGPDGSDQGDGGGQGDAASDAGGDAAPDAGGDAAAPEPDPRGEKQPATPNRQQDERILDQLEEAPTYQEQEAKNRAGVRRGRVMEDK